MSERNGRNGRELAEANERNGRSKRHGANGAKRTVVNGVGETNGADVDRVTIGGLGTPPHIYFCALPD